MHVIISLTRAACCPQNLKGLIPFVDIMECVMRSCEVAFAKDLIIGSFLDTIFSKMTEGTHGSKATPLITMGAPAEGENKLTAMVPWYLDREGVLNRLKRRAEAAASGDVLDDEKDRADVRNVALLSRQKQDMEKYELQRMAAAKNPAVETFVNSICGPRRGAAVEIITDAANPDFGKPLCHFCRLHQEQLRNKSKLRNYQGGVATWTEREMEDEERAREKAEAALKTAQNKAKAEENKAKKAAEEAVEADKVQRLTAEMTAALALAVGNPERLRRLESVLTEGGFPHPRQAAKEALMPAKVAVTQMKAAAKAEAKARKEAEAAAAKAAAEEAAAARKAAAAAAKETKKAKRQEELEASSKRRKEDAAEWYGKAADIFDMLEGRAREQAFAALVRTIKRSAAKDAELEELQQRA